MDWKEFVLNLAIQSSIWQCLSGGARREIERPFLETKRILAGTGSVLVRPALCLSRLPRVWGLRGPSPAWPQVGTKESRDRSWTQPDTGERVLHNMCWHQPDPDNNWQVFWKLFRVHQRDLSLADTCHVREGRSVVSCPGLWTMQTPRSEEIQSSHESGSGHPAMASLW